MFLIHTEPCDLHAIAATCILRERGSDVARCIALDFPASETISFRTSGADRSSLTWEADGRTVDADAVQGVWYRRPRSIRVPDRVHASDREYAYNECSELYRGFSFAPQGAFWVNPIVSQSTASNKVLQLRLAVALGFQVPETLVSNQADEVRAFVGTRGDVIYKPMRGASWLVDGKVHGTYTTPVAAKDLPSDALLRACPGIYQRLVLKRFEVRAQFFGHSCIAVRIDSNRMEYGEYDWRRHQLTSSPNAAPVDLPEEVNALCLRMMRELGIVSGAFDFIVDLDGDWVFLEVNPVGQFAFLELWCPDLPVMSTFCDFLESCDPCFRFAGRGHRAALADVVASEPFKAMMADDKSRYDHRDIGRRPVMEEQSNPTTQEV